MRCLWAIAVSLLLAASTPMLAQRGGSHASGGGHAGFSGHAGGFSGGHSFGGFHSGSSSAPCSFSRGPSRGPIASRGFNRGFNRGLNRGGTHFRIRTYGFRNNCYGYNCGYGYGWGYPYLWGGIDPYWWWDNDSDKGYDPGQPYNYDDGLANQMYQRGIPMRPPESNDQNYSAHSTPPQHPAEHTEAATPTVLVFRDQHREEIQNYAIVGEMLWTFAPQKTKKIPLDDLDLPATQEANDERGIDFRVPGA